MTKSIRPASQPPTKRNKKFELMLTRRAKAYSSYWTTTELLRLLRGYRSLMPSCASFLEPRTSRLGPSTSESTLNAENFKCSFYQLISAQFALEMCLAARNRQKINKNPYFGVQGHPRSLNSVAIESQCTISYY